MPKTYAALVEKIEETTSILFQKEMIDELQFIEGEFLFCEVSDDKKEIKITRKVSKEEDKGK